MEDIRIERWLRIRHPHLDKILDGQKDYEIRSKPVRFAPAWIGVGFEGRIQGLVYLEGCFGPMRPGDVRDWRHGVRPDLLDGYTNSKGFIYAWGMTRAIRLVTPYRCRPKRGAQVWEKLSPPLYFSPTGELRQPTREVTDDG